MQKKRTLIIFNELEEILFDYKQLFKFYYIAPAIHVKYVKDMFDFVLSIVFIFRIVKYTWKSALAFKIKYLKMVP